MEAEALYALGRETGLTAGAELRAWVQVERNRIDKNREQEEKNKDREERARERERQVEEAERQARERESVRQVELIVSEIEAEVKLMAYKVRLAECGNARVRTSSPTSEISGVSSAVLTSPQRWMAAFDEKTDDLDAHLLRFQRLAQGRHCPRDQWATMLSLCLKGEALSVISRLSPGESADYDAAKNALMRRFRLTADGFREKFRDSKPGGGESGAQFAARLASLFDHWVDLAKTPKTYGSLRDLLLSEQFLRACSPKLSLFIRERSTRTLADMADLADRYLEAQGTQSLGIKAEEKKQTRQHPRSIDKKDVGARPPLRCFLYDCVGHRAADCREGATTRASCWRCGQTGHYANACQQGAKGRPQASCCVAVKQI